MEVTSFLIKNFLYLKRLNVGKRAYEFTSKKRN